MNKTAKHYFDLAFEYHMAALTLHVNIFESPYLYNPTSFLLRHSMELLLKGLIIRETQKHKKIAATRVTINNRKLNQTHSLLSLWKHFRSLYTLDKSDTATIERAIMKLDKKDLSSERYRYPYKKGGQPIPTEPVVFDISDIAPDLDDGIPFIIQTLYETKVITKGSTLLIDIKTLLEETQKLFNIAEQE